MDADICGEDKNSNKCMKKKINCKQAFIEIIETEKKIRMVSIYLYNCSGSSNAQRARSCSSLATCRVTQAGQVGGETQDEEVHPGPPGWRLGMGLSTPLCKILLVQGTSRDGLRFDGGLCPDCGTSCVTCCAVLLEPQLLDIMIVQFRNEKVSNHGSIPITIDCNVVAFIVFEEGFHQPIKRTKQSVFLDVTVFRHTLVD
ncbi:hypothetical protein TNCV_2270621 [Trichonephila clavipes]|nr:hypothetical protein TNCV_2270621 [Trichonephila clavipes]